MASSRRFRKRTDYQGYFIIASLAMIALGYYMLDHVATWEDPPLGNTFHIVMGCILMALAGLWLIKLLRERYFPKRKKKRERPIFLDELQKNDKNDTPNLP